MPLYASFFFIRDISFLHASKSRNHRFSYLWIDVARNRNNHVVRNIKRIVKFKQIFFFEILYCIICSGSWIASRSLSKQCSFKENPLVKSWIVCYKLYFI